MFNKRKKNPFVPPKPLTSEEENLKYNVPEKNEFSDLDNFEDLDNIDDFSSPNLNHSQAPPNNEDIDDFNDDLNSISSVTESRAAMEKNPDLLKYLTDLDGFYKELAIEWLSLIWDQKEQDFVPDPLIEPMVNIRFVKWAIPYMKTYVRKNNYIVHLEKEDYKNFMEDVIDDVYTTIAVRKKDFGIKEQTTMLTVSSQMVNSVGLMLTGSGGGRDDCAFRRYRQRGSLLTPPAPL